jgi:hypothetical protein
MSIKTFIDGNAWCATFEDFTDISECPSGFGNTPEDATEALLKDALKRANSVLQEIKPAQEYADDLIARVKEHVLEAQTGINCSVAVVSFRPASIRSGYDTKALDKYAVEHPEINNFKKPIEYKASAALKWLETI